MWCLITQNSRSRQAVAHQLLNTPSRKLHQATQAYLNPDVLHITQHLLVGRSFSLLTRQGSVEELHHNLRLVLKLKQIQVINRLLQAL